MSSQPPLPLVPVADAIEIGPAAGLVEDEAGGRVFIHGNLAYAWDAGDEGLRRLAAMQLAELKIARAGQVAAAFGIDGSTLFRWRKAVSTAGVGGLNLDPPNRFLGIDESHFVRAFGAIGA